jgi:hypothetical protein
MKYGYSYLIYKRFLLVLIFSPFVLLVFPQETSTCAENLKNAQTLFENGQVEQIPDILSECLRSGFKQEEELAAYKLIIQTFLFQDMNIQADSAMLAFLKKYPEYQLSPTDHSSFVHLYNNFRVKPVVQLAIHVGTNIPFVTFVDQRSVSGESAESFYSSNALNLQASLEAKFAISNKLELNIEGGYSQMSFTNEENFLDIIAVKYSETQHRIEIPLTATYNIKSFGKFTVYARAGAGTAFNLAANANAWKSESGDIDFTSLTSPVISRMDSRIKIDLFIQAGGGIKLKIPKGYLNFEIRTNLGVYDQTVSGGADATQLEWVYLYKDDYFNLNNVNFTLGYTVIFYKPSKI